MYRYLMGFNISTCFWYIINHNENIYFALFALICCLLYMLTDLILNNHAR